MRGESIAMVFQDAAHRSQPGLHRGVADRRDVSGNAEALLGRREPS